MSKEKAMLLIDMPKSCRECELCVTKLDADGYEELYCSYNEDYGWLNKPDERLSNCPLKPISSGGEAGEVIDIIDMLEDETISYKNYDKLEREQYQEKVKSFILTQQSELEKYKKAVELCNKQVERQHQQSLDYIKELKKPPTAKEVCKALSEYLGNEITFDNNEFWCYEKNLSVCDFQDSHNGKIIIFYTYLSPHLITMIGRFYEGVKDD